MCDAGCVIGQTSRHSRHASRITHHVFCSRRNIMAKYVGQRVKRTEDPRLIKGLGHYVDDVKLPDTLHVVFLRSMYAHAKIKSIDTSEASHAPGVVAVY